jgi:hypothetical protein
MKRERGCTGRNINKESLRYKRYKMRGVKRKFSSAIKRKFNESNDDGN